MGLFDFLSTRNRNTANTAKDRLRIIIAQERSSLGGRDYLPWFLQQVRQHAAPEAAQPRHQPRRGIHQAGVRLVDPVPGEVLHQYAGNAGGLRDRDPERLRRPAAETELGHEPKTGSQPRRRGLGMGLSALLGGDGGPLTLVMREIRLPRGTGNGDVSRFERLAQHLHLQLRLRGEPAGHAFTAAADPTGPETAAVARSTPSTRRASSGACTSVRATTWPSRTRSAPSSTSSSAGKRYGRSRMS